MILLGMFYKSNIINILQFGKSAKIIDKFWENMNLNFLKIGIMSTTFFQIKFTFKELIKFRSTWTFMKTIKKDFHLELEHVKII